MKHGWSIGAVALVVGWTLACSGVEEAPTRWDEAAEQVEAAPEAAPIGEIVPGSAFNDLMPANGFEDHARVFTQEKEGYAEAEFTKGDDTVTVSISDTRDHPSAREKFAKATETVSGHPALARGKNSSLMLVRNRFQVRISAPHLDHTQRLAWLSAVPAASLADLH